MNENGRSPRESARIGKLLPAIRKTVRQLSVGPEHAGLVRLAEVMASTIDKMDPEQRSRLLGQTAPGLLRVLEELAQQAPSKPEPHTHAGYGLERLRLSRVLRATGGRVPEVWEMGCECLACHTERARREAESA
jgi:hypothetical protein